MKLWKTDLHISTQVTSVGWCFYSVHCSERQLWQVHGETAAQQRLLDFWVLAHGTLITQAVTCHLLAAHCLLECNSRIYTRS